jgi:hypothetical protein
MLGDSNISAYYKLDEGHVDNRLNVQEDFGIYCPVKHHEFGTHLPFCQNWLSLSPFLKHSQRIAQ